MFRFLVFQLESLIICQHFLKSNYILFTTVNLLYNKFTPKIFRKFNTYLLKTFSVHWLRVSFRGKGYRLRKFKKFSKVTLNFGHSHWAKIALDRGLFFFKKLKRQNYICSAYTYWHYKQFKSGIKFFKKLNTYTKRGLRLKKQYIKKRFGKISQVVSSLH